MGQRSEPAPVGSTGVETEQGVAAEKGVVAHDPVARRGSVGLPRPLGKNGVLDESGAVAVAAALPSDWGQEEWTAIRRRLAHQVGCCVT